MGIVTHSKAVFSGDSLSGSSIRLSSISRNLSKSKSLKNPQLSLNPCLMNIRKSNHLRLLKRLPLEHLDFLENPSNSLLPLRFFIKSSCKDQSTRNTGKGAHPSPKRSPKHWPKASRIKTIQKLKALMFQTPAWHATSGFTRPRNTKVFVHVALYLFWQILTLNGPKVRSKDQP